MQDFLDFNRNSFQDNCVVNRTSALCDHQDNSDLHSAPFQEFYCTDIQDFSQTFFPDLSDQGTWVNCRNSSSHSCALPSKFSKDQIYGERVIFNQSDTVSSLVTLRTPSLDTNACCYRTDFSLDMVALHERVFASGLPNYRGLRIPLVSKLIIPRWRSYLSAYHDNIIVDYLEFGWPVGYDYRQFGFPVSQLRNHTGATNYPCDLALYLDTELSRHSVAGPFSSPPFSGRLAVSPLNSVPKKDSNERRIILDLSWPLNMSVNAGIDKSLHEGVEFSLTYPTVDHITSLIARKGPGLFNL